MSTSKLGARRTGQRTSRRCSSSPGPVERTPARAAGGGFGSLPFVPMDTDATTTGPIPPAEDAAYAPDSDQPTPPEDHGETSARTASSSQQIVRTSMTIACWLLVAAFGAFAVMRVFGLERTWYLNTLVSFTPYVALLSVVSLVVIAVTRRWWPTSVAAIICVTLFVLFVPRLFGGANPGPGPRLRVMSSNMKVGAADPAAIVSLVRKQHIDVLAIDEYTMGAQEGLRAAGLETLLPYTAQTPIPGATGSAIYSRYPLRDTGYRPLAGGFGQEYATVLVPGAQPLIVEAVHTRAPVSPSADDEWRESIRQEPDATPDG